MKIFSLVFISIIIGGPFTVWAGSDTQTPDNAGIMESQSGWTAEDHMAAAKAHEQEARILEAKISKLQQKISVFSKKPYLDTKGLRRDSLRRIAGKSEEQVSFLREQVAWHQKQVNQLIALH